MKKIPFTIGVILELLGGLWLLQGLGLVHIKPILCFANCEPVQGPSTTWVIVGFVTAAIGTALILHAIRRRGGSV